MKYLLFFTALIATATAEDLICQCSGPQCTAATCTIPAGQCYSSLAQIATEKDKPLKLSSKGCLANTGSNVCKDKTVVFISTDDVFYLLSISECCNVKECNKDIVPDISALNKTVSSKKLVCPSCFTLGKNTCDAKQMYCREGQDKCFNISGTIKKGETAAQDFIAKGCAPPNAILRSNTTLAIDNIVYKLEKAEVVEAKSGVSLISSCLSFAILLPSVLWFLLGSSLY